MHEYVSPRLAATALGVSESSLKRWSDRGLLAVVKTAGGHRRVAVAGLVQFARAHGHAITRPEMLGLPAGQTRGAPSLTEVVAELADRLLVGDGASVRRLVLGAFVGGQSVATIVDGALAPAFSVVGQCWSDKRAEVYQEHRASEIALGVLHELRLLLPEPPAGAPLAIGGALGGDHYTLPMTCAELVLRESGFNGVNLGCNLPGETFASAVTTLSPRLCFVSVSAVPDVAEFVRQMDQLFWAAQARGAFVVIGGQALSETLKPLIRFGAALDSMTRLEDLAQPLGHPAAMAASNEPRSQ